MKATEMVPRVSASRVITRDLVLLLRRSFRLDWQGIHGAPHWARVRHNGLVLAGRTGALAHVVELFAFLHDSCRAEHGFDRDHGKRAARFAESLNGRYFRLPPAELGLLVEACEGHSHESQHADMTVLTCWDADRLDLGRVHIRPDPERLCTDAARDPVLLQAAYGRSLAWLEARAGARGASQ